MVADAVSGDLGPGLLVERLAEDNATVRQTAVPVGTGGAVALRWRSPLGFPDHPETIRVRSASCTTDCGADDGYRLRALRDDRVRSPRFNDVGEGQVTVLVLQNATDRATLGGHRVLLAAVGLRLCSAVPLTRSPPRGALVIQHRRVLASAARAAA